ncbi:Neurotransmitter-gated ion-channel transmembrane region, partial [Ostertagia ostertagi]
VPARNETNVFDDQPYPSLYFYLVIQRRTLYYGLNLIIPSLLISLMTVLGFTLPPDAGEKITLGRYVLQPEAFFSQQVFITYRLPCFFFTEISESVPARNETNVFDDQPYPSLYFYLVIQRRTLYYGLNLIIPSLLISLMTVLGFTLPPDAGEKITLGRYVLQPEAFFSQQVFITYRLHFFLLDIRTYLINIPSEITILLSVCFFLSMVADMTPPTSEAVPLIGAFFSCCMLVVSASVVFTVLVLNLHNRKPETHEMSPFLRECLLIWLPWILMMRRPGTTVFNRREIKARKAEDMAKRTETRNGRSTEGVMTATDSLTLIRSIRAGKNDHQNIELGHLTTGDPPWREMPIIALPNVAYSESNKGHRRTTGHTKQALRFRCKDKSNDEQAENDWKFAAMVVDRLCLFIFTIFIVVSTCGIMFSSPHLIA